MKLFFTIFFTVLIAISAFSRSGWVTQIPNGNKNSCNNCHPSGNYGQTNEFGKAAGFYVSGGKVNWGEALALLDSDGDGFTNGAELQDPDGKWIQGNPAPGDFALVTNPGDASSFPNENYVEDFTKICGLRINSIYPNPITDNSIINFEIFKQGYLKVELYNYAGLIITLLEEDNYKIGNYIINFKSIKYLNSGEYFLKIYFNGYSCIEKIIVIN